MFSRVLYCPLMSRSVCKFTDPVGSLLMCVCIFSDYTPMCFLFWHFESNLALNVHDTYFKCPSGSIFRALSMECMPHANELNRAGKNINRFGFLHSCSFIQTKKQSFPPPHTSFLNRLLELNIMEKKHWKKASSVVSLIFKSTVEYFFYMKSHSLLLNTWTISLSFLFCHDVCMC